MLYFRPSHLYLASTTIVTDGCRAMVTSPPNSSSQIANMLVRDGQGGGGRAGNGH